MKMILFFLIIFLNLQTFASNFSSKAEIINNGENRYKAIQLTPEIYSASQGNLSDILIYNERGETVPYFINGSIQSQEGFYRTYEMNQIHSFLKNQDFYYDYTLLKYNEGDLVATSIKMETTNINFAKKVELYGGYDNINWEKIQRDTIYRVDENEKLEIVFSKALKYTHYRFKILNHQEKVSFDRVSLVFSEENTFQNYFIKEMKAKFTVEEKEKITEIQLEGLLNLKINNVEILSQDVFNRRVWFKNRRGEKNIYNLAFDNTNYRDTLLPFHGFLNTQKNLLIEIENKDDKPIRVEDVIVSYYVDEIIFDGSKGEKFTLLFGNPESKKSPQYDIESYKDLILKEGLDLLEITNVEIQEVSKQEVQDQERDYRVIFNIVVVGTTVLLGVLFFRKLRQKH
jgi:hypothetical protein